MKIIGRGLIATALATCSLADEVVFAAGVSDSACHDDGAYQRELQLLEMTLADCQRENRRIVYFSSAGRIYGPTNEPRDEETPCCPDSRYGRHKLACESRIRAASCPHLIIRLANLVGAPQNPQQLIPQLVRQALSERATILQRATRDLLGTDRLSQILQEVVMNVGDRETIVLASGISLPVTTIFAEIQEILACRVCTELVDAGDCQEFRVDRMRSLAPYHSRFTSDYPCQVLHTFVPALARLAREGVL